MSMDGLLQLFAAVLFVLWDRSRMLRGAWRRGEWRNVARHALWISAALALSAYALAIPLWLLWTYHP